MARLDRQMFEDLSETTGFQIDVLEKVYRLTELLRDLSGMELGNNLSLKGGTAKDLYDTYQLLASDLSFNREAMRKCFHFSLCLNGDPRDVNSTNLDQITGRELRQSLLPMLRKRESVELAEMKGKVKPLAEDFLTFRDTEMEFVERLFEEEQYEPELLFQNVEFNGKLENHPGIDWRLRNI